MICLLLVSTACEAIETGDLIVDMEKYVDVPAPWCGTAVITVHDYVLSGDLLSEKHQVEALLRRSGSQT